MYQNLSWLSNEQPKQKFSAYSPAASRELKSCLSFASIKQHKNQQQKLGTPRYSVSKVLTKRIQDKQRFTQRSKQNRQLKQLRKQLKQRQKQKITFTDTISHHSQLKKRTKTNTNQNQSSFIVESYQIQNQSLKATIQILKQQVSAINSNYQLLKKQNIKIKQQSAQNIQKIQRLQEQLQKYRNKQKQFQDIMPKIQELELLQDRVIEENGKYKEREGFLKGLLAEILVAVGTNYDSTSLHIKEIINLHFNQL